MQYKLYQIYNIVNGNHIDICSILINKNLQTFTCGQIGNIRGIIDTFLCISNVLSLSVSTYIWTENKAPHPPPDVEANLCVML